MPIKPLPIGTGVNLDVSDSTIRDTGVISMVNCYIDRGQSLRVVPGVVEWADLGVGPHPVWSYYSVQFDTLVVVSAGRVWVNAGNGGMVEVTGVEITEDYPPCFTEDGSNIFLAANSRIHKVAGLAATILGTDTPRNVTSLAYLGGYLIAKGDEASGGVAGDTHYSDDKANGYATWEVYNNESRPDALMALVVAYEQVYNIGRTTLEVTYIDGTVPFSVNKNAAQHFGTMAAQSVAFDGQSIYYLSEVAGSRKVIELKGGGAPGIISFPIDLPLDRFERVDDAQGFIMAFRGQNGYALAFPSANCIVDAQHWDAITLFYHLQQKQWLILAKWNAENGVYGPYRGVSSTYVEQWGLRLIGGRDGKLYRIQENAADYAEAPVLQHRWRDDGAKEWKNARNISIGLPGEYRQHPHISQCGKYRSRQHELVYVDHSDAGEVMRAAVKTGHVERGTNSKEKRANSYWYSLQKGQQDLVLNSVTEDYNVLR